MKFFIKILKELKGEFTIKDLKFVVKKYMPMGYWGKIEAFLGYNKIIIPNCSRKEFDIWIIKFIKKKLNSKYNIKLKIHTFFIILNKKAQENTLFLNFLDFTDIKEIEKNIIKFLNKFKKKYTKKFLIKEINLFMPYVWNQEINYNEYMYTYNYDECILDKEPFGLNKKEFEIWIIKQLKNYYNKYKYKFLKEFEIYNQFFFVFIKRANFEIQNNIMLKILKNLKKKFTIKTLITTMYKYCNKFPYSYSDKNKKKKIYDYQIPYEIKYKISDFSNKNFFNTWIIKQVQNYQNKNISSSDLFYYMEQTGEIFYVFFFYLFKKLIHDYKNLIIKKNIFSYKNKKILNYKKNYYVLRNIDTLYFYNLQISDIDLYLNDLTEIRNKISEKKIFFLKEIKKLNLLNLLIKKTQINIYKQHFFNRCLKIILKEIKKKYG